MTGSFEANTAARRTNLKHGTATIQFAICAETSWSPFVAFAGNVYVRKVRSYVMPIAQVHAGTNRHGDVCRNVNRNVACGGFQHGITALSACVDELYFSATPASFHPGGWNSIELNASGAGICAHAALCRSQANAATAGLNVGRSANITEVDIAAAGRRLHPAHATLYIYVTAARLDHRALFSGEHYHIASARLGVDLSFHRLDGDIAAAGFQLEISAHSPDLD